MRSLLLGLALVLAAGVVRVSAEDAAPFGPSVVGKIVWAGHDLSRAQVRVYRDANFSQLVDQFGTGGENGTFVLLVDPGEYYLMAVVDDNANGKLDAGDGLGTYGVTEFGAAGQQPRLVRVAAGAVVSDVAIPVTAVLGADGKPTPAKIEGPLPAPAPLPAALPATLGGKVTGAEGLKVPLFLLVLKAADRSPAGVIELAAAESSFQFTAPPGDYLLLAVADTSGDRKLGAGDTVGVYGVSDWAHPPTELPKLTLASDAKAGGLEIALTGHLQDDGVVSPADGKGSLRLDLASLPAILAGSVPYPAAGLKPVQVRLTADPSMAQPLAEVEAKPGAGSFVLAVPPRTYFLSAVVDENGDGRLGPGDALGFYGVASLDAGTAPTPVTVGPAAILTGLEIAITVRINEEGKPAPLKPEPGAAK